MRTGTKPLPQFQGSKGRGRDESKK